MTSLNTNESVSSPILETRGLTKRYQRHRRIGDFIRGRTLPPVRAVDGVNLVLNEGEVLGLAGESGSGKTVTAELIAGLQTPSSGAIIFRGQDMLDIDAKERRLLRRKISMVFQDPFESLNPRWRLWMTISESLQIQGIGDSKSRRAQAIEMLERVHLRPPDFYADKFPHELSGGERQRAAVARALMIKPEVLIADEPTTMLDVSIRAGLLNLLRELQQEEGLSLIFISHDFSTLSYLCNRVAIMYRGVIVEEGVTEDVIREQLHPYTHALISAIPRPDPTNKRKRITIAEHSASSIESLTGCRFADRCPKYMDDCSLAEPRLTAIPEGHRVACYLHAPIMATDSQRHAG